jgi:hypothetical protein
VIGIEHERTHLRSPRLACRLMRGTDHQPHFGRHHVAVGVHRNEQATALERESHTTPRRCRAGGAPQSHRLALEIEQLFGIDFSAFSFERFEQATLDRGKLLDLFGELGGVRQDLPRHFQRQRDGRRRGTPEIVGRNRAHRFEWCLREQGAHATRVFTLPAAQLDEVGVRQNELDGSHTRGRSGATRLRRRRRGIATHASEDDPARREWLEPHRDGLHHERAASFGDAVHELCARAGKASSVAHLG